MESSVHGNQAQRTTAATARVARTFDRAACVPSARPSSAGGSPTGDGIARIADAVPEGADDADPRRSTKRSAASTRWRRR